MKNIKELNIKELFLVNKLISNQKDEFFKFSKLGWTDINIENHLKKKNNFSIGYYYNDIICGFLIGEKIKYNFNYDLEVHIMFVAKENRRHKIGSNLINYIALNKKLLNISKIYLEVSENNLNAIKFYEKNNFVFIKFRHNYYKYNEKKIHAMCYSRLL